VLASEALSDIDGSSGYGARIDAAGFDMTLRIDASAEAAGIAGGIVFVGGAGTSTLVAPDLANTWTLAGEGSGDVGTVTFTGVEHLIGGSEADTLAGTVQNTVWNITGGDSGEVDGMLFEEIENLLVTHPQVADVAVFGVPNDEMGEEVKAVVQPLDPTEAGPALAAALQDFCRQHLARYKCPRTIDFTTELPRAPTGKLYKRLLRDKYWEGRKTKIV